jgi:hypothetical protein
MASRWLLALGWTMLLTAQGPPERAEPFAPEQAVERRRILDGKRVRVKGALSLTWEYMALRSTNCREPEQRPGGFARCSLAIEIAPGAERDEPLRRLERWRAEVAQGRGFSGDVIVEATGTLTAARVLKPSPELPELVVPFPPGFGATLHIDRVVLTEQPRRTGRPGSSK